MPSWTGGFGGSFGSHFQLVLESHEVSVNVPGNYSTIEVNLYVVNNSYNDPGSPIYNNNDPAQPWSVGGTIGASGSNGSYSFGSPGQTLTLLGSTNYNVGHNNDGTGSVSLSASANLENSPLLTTASASGSYSLTTIDRTPAITSFYDTAVGINSFELVATTDLVCSVIGLSINGGGSYVNGGSGTSGSFNFTGLTPNTTYTCYCYGTDAASGITTYGGPIYVTTAPAPPSFLMGAEV